MLFGLVSQLLPSKEGYAFLVAGGFFPLWRLVYCRGGALAFLSASLWRLLCCRDCSLPCFFFCGLCAYGRLPSFLNWQFRFSLSDDVHVVAKAFPEEVQILLAAALLQSLNASY